MSNATADDDPKAIRPDANVSRGDKWGLRPAGDYSRRHCRRRGTRSSLFSGRAFDRLASPRTMRATTRRCTIMGKAYWVSCYRSISDPDAVAAYAKLAGPALAAAGGRFLARGIPAQTYEAGVKQRMVLVEFDSVAAATACHEGAAYQAALKVFNGSAERDFRIIEGLE